MRASGKDTEEKEVGAVERMKLVKETKCHNDNSYKERRRRMRKESVKLTMRKMKMEKST